MVRARAMTLVRVLVKVRARGLFSLGFEKGVELGYYLGLGSG